MVLKLPLALAHSAPGDARSSLRVLYLIICVMLYYRLMSRQRRICGDCVVAITARHCDSRHLAQIHEDEVDPAEMIDPMCMYVNIESTEWDHYWNRFYFLAVIYSLSPFSKKEMSVFLVLKTTYSMQMLYTTRDLLFNFKLCEEFRIYLFSEKNINCKISVVSEKLLIKTKELPIYRLFCKKCITSLQSISNLQAI